MNMRQIVRRLSIVVLTFVASSCALGGQAPNASTATCSGTWAPQFQLQHDGRPVFVDPGLIAPLGDRMLVLGTPTFFWLGRDSMVTSASLAADPALKRWSFSRAGALIDAAGNADGVPRIDTAAFRKAPRLIGIHGSEVSVAWEASGPPYNENTEFFPVGTRVEIATFRDGRWTAPETIMRARRLYFDGMPAVRPVPGADLGVVAAMVVDPDGTVFRVAQRRGATWSIADWSGAMRFYRAEALPTSDGSIALVMLVSMKDPDRGLYSVRGVWSGDSVTWSPPIPLDSIGRTSNNFASARLGGDSLIVVRSRTESRGARPGDLMTALSVDGGRAWQQTAPLAIGSEINPRLIVDATGLLHLMYRGSFQPTLFNAPGAIMHAVWRRGEWSPPEVVSASTSVTSPAVGLAPGGRVLVTWTDAKLDQGGTELKTAARLWSPSCGR